MRGHAVSDATATIERNAEGVVNAFGGMQRIRWLLAGLFQSLIVTQTLYATSKFSLPLLIELCFPPPTHDRT